MHITKLLSQVIEYLENYDNDVFINDFSTMLTKVTDENLSYLMEIVNIDERKQDSSKEQYPQVTLSLQNLQEIKYLAYSLNELKRLGIDTTTYGKKVASFNKLRAKALDTFSLYIEDTLPFSNPSELYKQIDIILSKSDFNQSRKQVFLQELNLRKRNSNQKHMDREAKLNYYKKFLQLPEEDHRTIEDNYYCDDEHELDISTLKNETIAFIEKHSIEGVYSFIDSQFPSDAHLDEECMIYKTNQKDKLYESGIKLKTSFIDFGTFKSTIKDITSIDLFTFH